MLVSYQGYNKMEAWNAGVCSVKLLIDYSSYLHFVSQPGFYLVMENLYLPPFEGIGFFPLPAELFIERLATEEIETEILPS